MSNDINITRKGLTHITGVPDGFDARVIADLARLKLRADQEQSGDVCLVHVARDDQKLAMLAEGLAFFAPDIAVLQFPAWDCLPYDRASPSHAVASRRLATLGALVKPQTGGKPTILLTTVNAALQRVPPRAVLAASTRHLAPGQQIDMGELARWLSENGYERTSTVRDPASFAVRGGILDLFPPATDSPVRLDFFGDTLESLRAFDAESQRTTSQMQQLDLVPVSEALLSEEAIRRFRTGYREAFGAVVSNDPLYGAVSEGRRAAGMEHWLPLFHEQLENLFSYCSQAVITLDELAGDARATRLEQISDYYQARIDNMDGGGMGAPPYKPLPTSTLYLDETEWDAIIAARVSFELGTFQTADAEGRHVVRLGARRGHNFAAERADPKANVFDAVVAHAHTLRQGTERKVAIACWSAGSRERMQHMLADHGLGDVEIAEDWPQMQSVTGNKICMVVLGLETGFETHDSAFISEQDILGDRLLRPRKRGKRAADFLTEATSLSAGDLVVHVDHGIGRFEGLRTIEAAGAPHDCLELIYAGGDKLYLPVENIELLSRYGSDETGAQLDRLGGVAWQSRKAKLKQRIREMAGELIKIAAARQLRAAPAMTPPDGAFDEFCARFPFEETEDQEGAIEAVLKDLASGRPMDRLVCGDVGFGKTEVALRSAFVTAMSGRQVAVVVPTTLLARQHFRTFRDRFKGLPVRIEQASRLVTAKDLAATKKDLESGDIDIVVGTHALLGKSIKFRDLGLLIVDEEQHFGVAHKERLKQMRAEVHVLTLTATPIPRTLQLALSGVRELSIIATPPVDRLAVRTFITPFDPVVVREALLREHYRGGQTFYVCPRIADLAETQAYLAEHVPEVKVAVAHGQMAPGDLEDIMTAFYEGRFDVLLSTTIVESGLDIPTANTLIVHRADMFGLAQLYQLRGRVGRSKTRAYALLTLPPNRRLTPTAEKRLKVLQSLDTLGAGFMLASHDLDIRGAGNLLGDEQSGHIKEVGFELYQAMLEEAVAQLRDGDDQAGEGQWSPQIAVGAAILIPENYVADLDLRLGLYRRLSMLETPDDVNSFGAELADRFGPLPEEAEQLLKVVSIKLLCRRAGIAKIDAGPMGAVLAFREDRFANPAGLVALIARERDNAKLRPDHRLVLKRDWMSVEDRLKGVDRLLRELVAIAEDGQVAA